ncbi:virulence factor Mce-like protein [Nocardia transvalensis]|uniref:Virulence factor Mce-like protein n=1 Tax=Nocardia transvalensis TaxID=37333 RepID=A0A7W9PGT8_9NOCA|nr:MCE family protein [Nocardia transvalensis]MBB5915418.1 virulence factor Mce-like protein [Nocardia transvalensis]
MSNVLRGVKLAAVALLGAVVAGCSSGPLGGITDSSITVTAQFANANGLYVGNPVSVLGMRVGKVTGIQPRGAHVDITMDVDKWVKIPADAKAVTVSDSVLTDRHIEFTPVYKGGPALADHAVLTADRTRVPVEFDSLLSMADKLSTSLGTDPNGQGPVAGLLDVGSQIAAGNGDSLRDAMSELARALQLGPDNGAATRAAVTKVVQNLDALTAAASRNDQALRDFGSGIHTLSDILADQNLGTGDTGAKLNEIMTRMTDLLERNRGNIHTLSGNANTMTKSLADYNDNLAEFLDVFPLVTDNAYNAIDPNTRALRGTVDLNKFLLDGQMLKTVCNLLNLKELGCATGTPRDMGPDFGIGQMLSVIAGAPPK